MQHKLNKAFALAILTLAWLGSVDALAKEDKAAAIIAFGEHYLRGETTQAVMSMTIQREDYTRKLKLRSWTQGNDKALVEILEPSKEEGVSSLRVAMEMWNYLPKTDQVVRVPTSLMLQSWMGSDFTNDDLMKASSLVRDYTHRIVRYQKMGKDKTVLIACTPKPNAPVVWGKILYWAKLSDHLPLREDYFDEKGKRIRTLLFSKYQKMDNRMIPARLTIVMADKPKEGTTVEYQKILYDRSLDQRIFDKENLRHNSQEAHVLTAGWFFMHLPKFK